MKRINFSVLLFIVISANCFSTENDLEGSYRQKGSYIGIQITSLNPGYLVQQVFLSDDNSILSSFEWQSAYLEGPESQFHFYWHTGRYEESLSDSNQIIVYDLEISNGSLIGHYYFPQEKKTASTPIEFIKMTD